MSDQAPDDLGHWAFRRKDASNNADNNQFPYAMPELGIVYLDTDPIADEVKEVPNADVHS